MEFKLWYALGKLRAEKAAWRIAKERDLKLVTICPGLITAPHLSIRNPTATVAYLKGTFSFLFFFFHFNLLFNHPSLILKVRM